MKNAKRQGWKQAAAALALSCCAMGAQAAATITIVNMNQPGIGFNDPTPVAPVGANTGTTLGEQRLIAFQHAADMWGRKLNSNVAIRVGASFMPLPCNANSAVLGAAGANEIWSDFGNAPRSNTWYPSALASKLNGADLTTPDEAHITARFNSRLGLFPDCLPGLGFYLGLDGRAGTQIDLVAVLLHELAHGLGFQNFTDDETGARIMDIPTIWDHFLIDNRSNKLWSQMTDAERVASAISGDGLSWNGPKVTAAVPMVLAPAANMTVGGPAAGRAAGDYAVGEAEFGPPVTSSAVTGQLMPVVDQQDGTGLACEPLNAVNALAVRNNIALVDRGACNFVVKVKHVQDAGAIGVVVADNAPGGPIGMTGEDESVVIPSVRITQAAGVALKGALRYRSRGSSGVEVSLGTEPSSLPGTDAQKRMLLYTPTTNAPGSSVSHYSVQAKPNQLMEPSINPNLAHDVEPPADLTLPLLQDIGW